MRRGGREVDPPGDCRQGMLLVDTAWQIRTISIYCLAHGTAALGLDTGYQDISWYGALIHGQ